MCRCASNETYGLPGRREFILNLYSRVAVFVVGCFLAFMGHRALDEPLFNICKGFYYDYAVQAEGRVLDIRYEGGGRGCRKIGIRYVYSLGGLPYVSRSISNNGRCVDTKGIEALLGLREGDAVSVYVDSRSEDVSVLVKSEPDLMQWLRGLFILAAVFVVLPFSFPFFGSKRLLREESGR